MSATDEEEPQYNEEEDDDDEYDQEDDDEEDQDYEQDTGYSRVHVAKNNDVEEDEEEEEEEEDDDEDEPYDEDEEAEEDEFSVLSNRASELVSQGQTDDAIQVLKSLTQALADQLPDLGSLPGERADDYRSRVLSTFALWIEIMRDGKIKASGDLADKLTMWQTTFVEDPNLGLLSTESDDEDEDEDDDKAIVKEFADLLEDLKLPSKKKQRA